MASLVAVEDSHVVGHVLFSQLAIDAAAAMLRGAALAPMAVEPCRQRQGIGSTLVRRGLELCRRRGCSFVLVVGHPHFYPRFGFTPELAKQLQSPYSDDAFIALELTPGALTGLAGTVRYPEAFSLFD